VAELPATEPLLSTTPAGGKLAGKIPRVAEKTQEISKLSVEFESSPGHQILFIFQLSVVLCHGGFESLLARFCAGTIDDSGAADPY
jgi:hypothetical protein